MHPDTVSRILNKSLVDTQIIGRHSLRTEMILEDPSAILPTDCFEPGHAPHSSFDIVNNETRQSISHNLRHRTLSPRDHRRSAGHCLDHDKAEGFRPIHWK